MRNVHFSTMMAGTFLGSMLGVGSRRSTIRKFTRLPAMVPYCLAVVCGGLLVGFLVERCLLAMEVMGKGR